jgi:carboxymethylenebutenolidase
MSEMITISSLDGKDKFQAYCAMPADAPKAAIIVIQEIFGVNKGIRQKCDKWASLGYLALAPDLFWRSQPGVDLDPDIPEQLQQGFGLMQQFSADVGVKDIEATIHAARAMINGGKVGAVGYCLGGRLAYMVACRTDISASVGYYGVMIDKMLNEASAIAHPLMLHIPTADHYVDPAAQAAIHAGLDHHPKVTLHDYIGLDHGFATEMGLRRNDEAAQLADGRTEDFFARHVA